MKTNLLLIAPGESKIGKFKEYKYTLPAQISMILQIILINLSLGYLAHASLSKDKFAQVASAFELAYGPELKTRSEYILINEPSAGMNPLDIALSHASYVQTQLNQNTYHHLSFMGGLAAQSMMTQDLAALILCHELGHGIGGPPYKVTNSNEKTNLSVEGQADYYATSICLPKIWPHLIPSDKIEAPQGDCLQTPTPNKCPRSFAAIQAFTEFLQQSSPQTDGSLATATTINLDESYYPSNSCRIATLYLGALKMKRPNCWYAESP